MRAAQAADPAEAVVSPAGMTAASFARSCWSVFAKDVRCELRTRQSLSAVLLFAVTSTVAVSFTLAAWGSKTPVVSALLWLVIYFSAMSGLARTFVREEETQTAALLRLSAPPNAVFIGKLAFNLALLLAIELVAVPLFAVLMGCRIANWPSTIAVIALGSVGLSVGATVAAAMVSRAAVKGALFAVVSFPLLVPVLGAAIHGTNATMSGASCVQDMRLILFYAGCVLTASLMLFRFIWED